MTTARRRTAIRRAPRGQAMLEYSLLNWILVVALVIGSTVKVNWKGEACTGSHCGQNVLELFFEAYQIYFDSFYFVLNMPFP